MSCDEIKIMSVEKTEIETFFGTCRCCLSYGYLKNMWTEHRFEGDAEVYGEMLVQCFALTWEHTEDSIEQDQICEQCICRLRDAHDFKRVVLNSQEDLMQQIDAENEHKLTVKEEQSYENFHDDYVQDEDTAATIYDDTENTMDTMPSVKDETQYEEIEYLEDEIEYLEVGGTHDTAIYTDSSQITDQLKSEKIPIKRRKHTSEPTPDDDIIPIKRKWPKKLPKSERHKTYKQYSEVDLRKCIEEVRNNVLSAGEAALKYDIPKKTICAKIKVDPNEEQDTNREKMYQLLKEIKAILTFTNATPYKSKNVRYYCAYCSTDGPHFEDPDDLRTHTRTEHVSHRTENIEYAMRPYWMNEVIKLDIKNLLCTVCCVVINNWNEMFKHLKEKHSVVLDQAYTRVIPYILKTDLQCALCKESFSNYLHLDGHMNAHYNNYVCYDCGDTFLANNRLKQHVKIHNVGKFRCSFCEKIFSLHKYRRKHEELVHEQISKFKCLYCEEKFTAEYLRHLHCVKNHAEKVKTITCELCGETFTWKQYYTNHMRKKHQNKKPHECTQCDKKFHANYELKEHMLRHVGTKDFECLLCHKKYVSMNSLKQHMKQHIKKKEASN